MVEDDWTGDSHITTRAEGRGLALCLGDAGHWHVVTVTRAQALRLSAELLGWVAKDIARSESP